ncbi:hypothetical protein RCL1_006129 [Eukaryota sp. TZLM3-RCL]
MKSLLLTLLILSSCFAFDRHKWKFCSDFSHCTLHRSRIVDTTPEVTLTTSPVWNEKSSSLDFSAKSEDNIFQLSISFYDNCIFRVQANNEVPRYHSEHALNPDLSPLSSVDCQASRSSFQCHWGSCYLSLPSSVGSSLFMDAGTSGNEPLVSINNRNFLYLSPSEPGSIGLDFAFPQARSLYGLPEHALSFKLPHTLSSTEPIRLYNLDVFQYEVDSTFPLYGSIPFLVSSSPSGFSGVYWNNPSDSFVDIAYDTNEARSYFFSESGSLDAFILLGPTPSEVMQQWRFLTGTFPSPPTFSLGYHQCRWNYRDEQDVYKVLSEFEARDLPVDTLWLDIEHTHGKRYFTFDKHLFPNPRKLQEDLWKVGRRMVTISDPHIKKDTSYHVYKEAANKSLLVKDSNGNKDFEGHCWPGTSVYIDFLNPAAQEFWAGQYSEGNYKHKTEHLHTWNDMNEPSVFNHDETTMPRDVVHFDGKVEVAHRDVHNLYGFLMHKSTRKGHLKYNSNIRPFVLTRSFFAGSSSTGVAVWTGDNTANWDHLKASIPMLLSLSISGIGFSGADIGGFFGHPDAELMTRWFQLGAWYPFMRSHAHIDSPRREPWLFGKTTERHIRSALIERYSYIPYWKSLFYHYEQTGVPPLRPWWMVTSADTNNYDSEHVLFVGDAIMVIPVLEPHSASVTTPLPSEFIWFDARTGTQITENPATFEVTIDEIPVLQRGGTIIPRKYRLRRSTVFMEDDPITLEVALDVDGNAKGFYYNDDGISFDYQEGALDYASIELSNNILCWNAESSSYKRLEIERISVTGTTLKLVNVYSNIGELLHFTLLDDKVIIKKPKVYSDEDWCITLEFRKFGK